MKYLILSLSIACATESQIIHDGECPSSEIIEETTVVEVNQCPEIEIPACPDVHVECPPHPEILLACPEIPECPKPPEIINKVECPEPVVNVEVPSCPSMICECPEIPECPSLENVTVDLDATLTIDGEDFLTELSDLINGNRDLYFSMTTYESSVIYPDVVLFENNTSDTFILTGYRLQDQSPGCSGTIYLNGDPNLDLAFINPPQSTANFSGSSSLLTHNTGALPLEPGEFIQLELTSCFLSSNSWSTMVDGEFNVAIMGFYQ